MNILLLVAVGLAFWHVFGREGDSIATTTAPATSTPPTDNTDANAVATGDVTTTSATP